MKVLSLFDGMACGMLAMQKAGIEVERYVAYEIDKYAVQTSTRNFPMIEQKGDVFQADFTEYSDFDFLIGGSPCTYWSIAQKNNRETEASGMGWELFSQYVRALHEAKPKFFVYENNKSMSKAIRDSIDKAFGFEAIGINSALVSAQNRQRLYWVGKRNEDGTYSKVPIEQPEDLGILLKDILESGQALRDKQYTMDANYFKGGNYSSPKKQSGQRMAVAEPVCLNSKSGRGGVEGLQPSLQDRIYSIEGKHTAVTTAFMPKIAQPVCVAERGRYTEDGSIEQKYEAREDGKTNVLTTVQKDNNVAEPVCMRYERSDEAKAVRKQYEAKEIKHGFHELHELHPRTDGKTNTLSTVLKDNPICEPVRVGALPRPRRGRNMADKSNCCMTSCQHYQYCGVLAYATPCEWDEDGKVTKAVSCADGKTYTVYEVWDGKIAIKGKEYPIKLVDGYYIIRKLTVRECMRLQTVPEWYEFPVSDSQAYKMLGNGWTVDVIVHLLRGCMNVFLF